MSKQGSEKKRAPQLPPLPRVGSRTAEVLDALGGNAAKLTRLEPTLAWMKGESARMRRRLQSALEARRMNERLAARAGDLVDDAELAVDHALHALYAEAPPRLRAALFPRGVAAARLPRNMAQLSECQRILALLVEQRGVPAKTAVVACALAARSLALATRFDAAERAQLGLERAYAEEKRAEREVRSQYRQARGAVAAQAPLKKPVEQRRAKRDGAIEVPEAPPPTRLKSSKRKARP